MFEKPCWRVYNSNMRISELSDIMSALGNKRRLLIFLIIMRLEPICVCDIMKLTGLPQSSVSRALSFLRLVGLVSSERRGGKVCYSLDASHWAIPALKHFFDGFSIDELGIVNNFEKSC